jgi:hypothetical protein
MGPPCKILFPILCGVLLVGLAESFAEPVRARGPASPAAERARLLPGRYTATEPSVAASPSGQVIVAAMGGRLNDRPTQRLLCWRSGDRGATWDSPRFLSDSSEKKAREEGDVWLQTDGRGRFFAFYLERDAEDEEKMKDMGLKPLSIAAFKHSDDGGKTWSDRQHLGTRADRTVLALSPLGKWLAVAFTTVLVKDRTLVGIPGQVLRSGDRGSHWHEVATPAIALKMSMSHLPTGIAVNDEGAIAVAWHVTTKYNKSNYVISATRDGGRTWKEQELTPLFANRFRHHSYFSGVVALAQDGRGAVHALYTVPNDEKMKCELLLRSSADWQSWSARVDLSPAAAHDFRGYPALAAAADRLHVSWLERRGKWHNMWYRGSADRGKTWSAPVLLSRPKKPTDALTSDGFTKFTGDYMGLAEDGRGTVHAVWGAGGEIWHGVVH